MSACVLLYRVLLYHLSIEHATASFCVRFLRHAVHYECYLMLTPPPLPSTCLFPAAVHVLRLGRIPVLSTRAACRRTGAGATRWWRPASA